MKSIDMFIFQSTGVKTITIPSSVEEFGQSALDNCPKLEKIIISKGSMIEDELKEYGYGEYISYS